MLIHIHDTSTHMAYAVITRCMYTIDKWIHDIILDTTHYIYDLLVSCTCVLVKMWQKTMSLHWTCDTCTHLLMYHESIFAFLYVILVGFNPLSSKSLVVDIMVSPVSSTASWTTTGDKWCAICMRAKYIVQRC